MSVVCALVRVFAFVLVLVTALFPATLLVHVHASLCVFVTVSVFVIAFVRFADLVQVRAFGFLLARVLSLSFYLPI